MQVFSPASSFYAAWRVRSGAVPALREADESSPPERLLQAVWQHQRLRRDQLKTLDGEPVQVLHPGFKNSEAGPDFHGAMIQIGAGPTLAGDVEVDVRSRGWHAHAHEGNPAYQKVILHVVWESERPATARIPTLALRRSLDAPLAELNGWLGNEALPLLPESLRGQCCAPLRGLPPESLTALLHQAAQLRLESKAARLQACARQAGWEQSLWEGLFRALGYKQNVWPMQRLAELRLRWQSARLAPQALQARLLGLSGLLPAELTRASESSDSYLRRIWSQWWRERDEFSDCILPRGLWHFHGLRPANHPHRRLALAAHWLAAGNLPAKLEQWCAAEMPDPALPDSLFKVLQVGRDDFWSWHWTLRSARCAEPRPLLGTARVADLAMNVILPWFWVRAAEGGNTTMQRVAERRYFAWPAAEDNARLRLARQRLLGSAPGRSLGGAAMQQGLLQVLRDFCDNSNALCENCRLPELAHNWNLQPALHSAASCSPPI